MWGRLAGLMAVAALLCGACGSGGGSAAKPATLIVSSVSHTEAAKTAHLAMTISAGSISVNATGAADFAGERATYSMTIPGVGPLQIIQDHTVIYEHVPDALAARVGGKPWLRIDLNALAQRTGAGDLSKLLGQGSPQDATGVLDYLRGEGADTRVVGKETIRGVSTTHYAGSIDLNKAAAAATDPAVKQAVQRAAAALASPTLPVDVWVDGANLVRRIRVQYQAPSSSAGSATSGSATSAAPMSGSLTLDLYDFGVAFSLPALPPASQVTDLPAAHP